MAKKKSNSKKTPRTPKNSGRKPKSKNLLGKTAFNPYNHPAYAQGVKEGKAEVAAHVIDLLADNNHDSQVKNWYSANRDFLKNEKVKNSHKVVMEKYSKAFHDLKDDAYWEKGNQTDPKPCCAPAALAAAPAAPWYGFIFKIRDAVSNFLKGII